MSGADGEAGSKYRVREVLRQKLGDGGCGGNRIDSDVVETNDRP